MEINKNIEFLKTNDKLANNFINKKFNIKNINLRYFPEMPHHYRSEFSRDRDKILYSRSFRRLSGKTQVFFAGYDVHIRTRLTHTLEVSQISKTIADIFNFDTNLSEAISYGHDVGHTPFGHMGEIILNSIMNNCEFDGIGIAFDLKQRGFKHNLQSIRLLNQLESSPYCKNGLNLTYFTCWGILNHSSDKLANCEFKNACKKCTVTDQFKDCKNENELSMDFYTSLNTKEIKNSWSFEGLIVGWADEIAQRHHDVEDGFISKIINPEEVFEKLQETFHGEYFEFNKTKIEEAKREFKKSEDIKTVTSIYSSIIVDFYVTKYIRDINEHLTKIEDKFDINNENDFWKNRDEIFKDKDFQFLFNYEDNFVEDKKLKKFLQDRIIDSENIQIMNRRGVFILRKLFKAYFLNPLQLPDNTIINVFNNLPKFNCNLTDLRVKLKQSHNNCNEKVLIALARAICDYLANMTDEYALAQYKKLYGTTSVRNF